MDKRLEDDPLFRSVGGAVMFALNFSHGTMKKPSIVDLMGGGRLGKGLAGLDGAGQAAMIRASIERLSPLHKSVLTARYAAQSTPCACRKPCCRGYRENPEWTEAINWLTEYVLQQALAGTISHYRFRRAIVARYFGARVSFLTIAAECKVHRHTASSYNERIIKHFRGDKDRKGVEQLARFAIEGALKEAGVVE